MSSRYREQYKVLGGLRSLHAPLPEPLRQLRHNSPEILNPDRGELCEDSSINFVGVLLYALYQQQCIDLIEQAFPGSISDLDSHDLSYFTEPFRMISSVALWNRIESDDSLPEKYEDLQLVAPKVLMKRASGSIAGVVTEGPLTGTILEPNPRQPRGDFSTMLLNRVWSDQKIVTKGAMFNIPYLPHTHLLKVPLFDEWEKDIKMNTLRQALKDFYISHLPNQKWSRDVFLQFAQRLGITIDAKSFLYTRPIFR